MMNLTPYRRTYSIFDDLDKFFGNTRWNTSSCSSNEECATPAWTPAVDIEEREEHFLVKADLPGVNPKDVEITVENGLLVLKGERSETKESTEKNIKRAERVHGSFYRSFRLPEDVSEEAITASGKNGVLEISIPKNEKKQPLKIKIQ